MRSKPFLCNVLVTKNQGKARISKQGKQDSRASEAKQRCSNLHSDPGTRNMPTKGVPPSATAMQPPLISTGLTRATHSSPVKCGVQLLALGFEGGNSESRISNALPLHRNDTRPAVLSISQILFPCL